jgi:hypothetical protein
MKKRNITPDIVKRGANFAPVLGGDLTSQQIKVLFANYSLLILDHVNNGKFAIKVNVNWHQRVAFVNTNPHRTDSIITWPVILHVSSVS